jgi:hypothetical protein
MAHEPMLPLTLVRRRYFAPGDTDPSTGPLCETTHVLLPAWSVPRRRDGAEVIGAALLHKAREERPCEKLR